jgi:hypothetical protein
MLAREPTQPAPAFSDPRAVAKCQRLGKGGCLQALSSGEKDGSGGPEERRRRVEGHHHAGLRARIGFPERLNGAARVGARKTRAQLRTLRRRVATPCIGHTTTAVAVKQISGTSMGISPSCVFEMEQHAARIERLLDQEVLDRVEVARTS